MEKLMDLISEIIRSRHEDISEMIVNEILDELIEFTLDAWQKNPDIEFETLRKIIIDKLLLKERL